MKKPSPRNKRAIPTLFILLICLLAACGCRADDDGISDSNRPPEEDAILYQPAGLYRGELTKVQDSCSPTLESLWKDSTDGIFPGLGFSGYSTYFSSDALGGAHFKIPYLNTSFGGIDFQTGKRKTSIMSERMWLYFYNPQNPEPEFQRLHESCHRKEDGSGSELTLDLEQLNSETYEFRFLADWNISSECRDAFDNAFDLPSLRALPQDDQCTQEYVVRYRLVKECLGKRCFANGVTPVGEDPYNFRYSAYACQCLGNFSEVIETKWVYDPLKDPPLKPIKYTPVVNK